MEQVVTNHEEYRRALLDASKEGFRFARAHRKADGTMRITFSKNGSFEEQANNDA